MFSHFVAAALFFVHVSTQITYQNSSGTILRVDNGTYGPPAEEFHYYYDQYPIGLAVSSSGRLFVSYTRGKYAYTLGEAVNKTAGETFFRLNPIRAVAHILQKHHTPP